MKIIAINASIQDIDALKDFFGAITHQNPAAVYIIVLSDAMPQSIAHFQHEIDLPSHLNIQQVGNYTRLHTNNVYLLNTQQNFIVKNQALMHDIGWNSDAASYKSTFWGTLAQHHGSNAIGVAMQPTLEHTTGLEQLIDVGGTLMLNADTMNNLESLSIAPIDFDYIHPANQLVSCITWRRDLPQASWAVPPMSSTNDFPSNQGTDFQTAADSNDWLHTPVAHTPKRTAFINHAIQNYLPTLIYLNQKGQVLSYLGNTLQFFPTIQKGQYITSLLQNLSRESTSEVSDFTQSIHRMLRQSETSSVHVTHTNADGTINQIQIRISFDGK
ncbi:MAG: chemotaxis protein CheB, partial [Chitinophagales bacterium]